MFLNPNIFFSNMNSNCSNLLYLRNLQEQVKKPFGYQKLIWSFTVWTNCSSDLKNFANSRPSASNFKSFSRSLDHFFLTILLKNTNFLFNMHQECLKYLKVLTFEVIWCTIETLTFRANLPSIWISFMKDESVFFRLFPNKVIIITIKYINSIGLWWPTFNFILLASFTWKYIQSNS